MSKLNNCTAQAINNILRIVDNKVKREITNIEGNQAIEHINQKLQQEIKDLMLDLVGYGSVDIDYDMDKLTLAEKAELVGRNKLTTELRQKVKEL